jgi:hypothetical protein
LIDILFYEAFVAATLIPVVLLLATVVLSDAPALIAQQPSG